MKNLYQLLLTPEYLEELFYLGIFESGQKANKRRALVQRDDGTYEIEKGSPVPDYSDITPDRDDGLDVLWLAGWLFPHLSLERVQRFLDEEMGAMMRSCCRRPKNGDDENG